jgi:hypothetical protein
VQVNVNALADRIEVRDEFAGGSLGGVLELMKRQGALPASVELDFADVVDAEVEELPALRAGGEAP